MFTNILMVESCDHFVQFSLLNDELWQLLISVTVQTVQCTGYQGWEFDHWFFEGIARFLWSKKQNSDLLIALFFKIDGSDLLFLKMGEIDSLLLLFTKERPWANRSCGAFGMKGVVKNIQKIRFFARITNQRLMLPFQK